MSLSENNSSQTPVVLCFSGHDPSGGAGIQADIEAIAAQSVHAASVITALTCQDSQNVVSFDATDADKLQQQAELILADMPVHAFKVGMTADVKIVQAIHAICCKYPAIPLILDPVLAAGGGTSLASEQLVEAIKQLLLPRCTLVTPNIPEAFKLSNCDNIKDAAANLLAAGANAVLITGSHAMSNDITHYLYHGTEISEFYNTRLTGEFHGSGCTLASSVSALIARGEALQSAVQQGLDYTLHSLQKARAIGHGQLFPYRLSGKLHD